MKIILLRVAADSGNLGFHSPLFKDGSYDYIPINETYNENAKNKGRKIVEKRTYGNTKSFKNTFLIDCFPEKKKEKFKNQIIHFDPEFETFTYGDPSFTKKKLGELIQDDYLLFYISLTNQKNGETGLYLFTYFCIETAINIQAFDRKDAVAKRKPLLKMFKNNFHVRHEEIFIRDSIFPRNKGLKLVKGNPKKSKVLKKPILISQYPKGKDPYRLSDKMQKIFGNFKGKISIQRNPLRSVEPEFIQKAANFIRSLE